MAVFSKGGSLRSPAFHKKKQREKWLKITVGLILLSVLVGLPIYLLRLDRFQISEVLVEGNEVTQYEDLDSIVRKNIEGNYFYIFPKSNALIYPKSKIEDDIRNFIPRIKAAEVGLSNLTSLKINLVEREPSGLYCENLEAKSEECYFIDSDGYIYSEAPIFSGDVYFVYSKDPAIENPLGQSYLPSDEFKKLPVFINSIEILGIHPRALQSTSNEYYVELKGGGKIIISKEDDLQVISANLESFLNDHKAAKSADFLQNISYIDLRFGNRVFYKPKIVE